MKRAFFLALSLLLISSIIFPYGISGKVRGSGTNNPILEGTAVELWDNGYLIASGLTDSFGKYSLNADAGTYLLILKRSNYPDHVYSLPVSSDTTRDAVMQKQPFVYGKVDSPLSLSGKEITMLKGGFVFAKSSLQDDGEYAFPPVPSGEYLVSVNFGDYLKSESISVPEKGSLRLDFGLEKTQAGGLPIQPSGPEAPATLSLPETAGLGQAIDAVLSRNGVPVAGARIDIQTPIGSVTRTTDGSGKVSITALDYGVYRFSHDGAYYLVYVLPPEGEALPDSQPSAQSAEEQAAPAEIRPLQGNAALLFFAVGFVLAIIVILALLIFLLNRGKAHKARPAGQEPQETVSQEPQTTLANYPQRARKKRRD